MLAHPELARSWNEDSNNLVIVTARNEAALNALCGRAAEARVPRAEFYEPDFDRALTAAAFFGESAGKLVSSLPLALRAPKAA